MTDYQLSMPFTVPEYEVAARKIEGGWAGMVLLEGRIVEETEWTYDTEAEAKRNARELLKGLSNED